MPATPSYALPYPAPTDPVAQGADAMRKLAQSTENMVQSGTAQVNITAADTNCSVTVTFPVAFAAGVTPIVIFNPSTGLPTGAGASHYWWASGRSNTGFTANARRSGAVNPFTLLYVAIAQVAAVT